MRKKKALQRQKEEGVLEHLTKKEALQLERKLEKLEHAAKTILATRLLGRVRELTPDELERLSAVAGRLGYGRVSPFPTSPGA